MKKHYKAVILVLASTNTDIYKKFKELYESYLNVNSDIKVFFVFGKQTSEILQVTDSNLVFDVEESYYPGMLTKTLKGIEHVLENYSFDYLVRTNLSTFWLFDKLLARLDTLPKTNFATGPFRGCTYKGVPFPHYIAGTSLVMTRDAAVKLVLDTETIKLDMPEDCAMTCSLISSGVNVVGSSPRTVEIIEPRGELTQEHIINIVSTNPNIDHYRVKSRDNFRTQDIEVVKYLLNHYYGKVVL